MSFFSPEYNSLHSEEDQLKRVKSALNLKMDYVDFEAHKGKIKNYDVSLDKCTCMDFGRRRKPCKHIYRLAIELGIFNANADTVSGSIVPAKEIDNKSETNCSYAFSCPGLVPKNFVVIDFETANTCPDSICQMGIVTVENNLIVDRQNYLIRPPYEKFSFTDIHGITLDDVKNELTFGELWQRIKPYIEGRTIAAYNLPFDINCLFAALFRYEIPRPNFNAFDVLANVRSCRYFDCELSELKNYQLVTVAKKMKLEHIAHNALSDSVVTAQIQIYLSKTIPDENTVIYFSTISALTEAVAKNQLSPAVIVGYCNELLKINLMIDYDEYKELFKLIEQVAANNDNASLYKCCGMFYEKSNRISRAISLYEKALFLNEKIGVKGKIQKLKKELQS
ncbi:MAG: SWIM zinc finger family protein [Selenomonadaceae bacterium]|nr:SWIM zinc finger family protein [Selenomonadaceae bacterium]